MYDSYLKIFDRKYSFDLEVTKDGWVNQASQVPEWVLDMALRDILRIDIVLSAKDF